MKFELIDSSSQLWKKVRKYAAECSWSAGKFLALNMDNGTFSDWERVIVAHDKHRICGYCTVSRSDCIPDVPYTPYIGYVFVGEDYRGNRLSQRLILCASEYLKGIGFNDVYLVSDHENLYEKYGFTVIAHVSAPCGAMEKIYHKSI